MELFHEKRSISLAFSIFLFLFVNHTMAIKCFKCKYAKGDHKWSTLKDDVPGKNTEECLAPSLLFNKDLAEDCEKDCLTLHMKAKWEIIARGCSFSANGKSLDSFNKSGCHDKDEKSKFLAEAASGGNGSKVEWKTCSCNKDHCSNLCMGGSLSLMDYCVAYWLLAIPPGVIVIIILCIVGVCCLTKKKEDGTDDVQ